MWRSTPGSNRGVTLPEDVTMWEANYAHNEQL
jgi:hypothetical protein